MIDLSRAKNLQTGRKLITKGKNIKRMEWNCRLWVDDAEILADNTYEKHCPYYIVTMVMHDQSKNIEKEIRHLEEHLRFIGCEKRHMLHGILRSKASILKRLRQCDRKLVHG